MAIEKAEQMEGQINDFPRKMELFRHTKASQKGSIEYWFARDLQSEFGYENWANFAGVIEKAIENCARIAADPRYHFAETNKMIEVGKGGQREIQDFVLSRVACYLIALNADSSKPQIAWAKAYFVAQTKLKEQQDKFEKATERQRLRSKLKEANRLLSGAAKGAGVENYGFFHDAGIRALYGMKMSELRTRKGLSSQDDYWDRAGSLELSANEFKAQLVRESLAKNRIRGQSQAEAEHQRVAHVVRKTVHSETGKYLEDLPLEPSLKKLLREAKKQSKEGELPFLPSSPTSA